VADVSVPDARARLSAYNRRCRLKRHHKGVGMLDARNHQGKFGQDYIRVLASAAGLLVCTPDLDYDGVDLLIRWPGKSGAAAATPAIDVQLKSWSNGLNEKQFNKLAGTRFTVPRYLFLVAAPKSAAAYSEALTMGTLRALMDADLLAYGGR
jgi:hypothetical protein